MPALVSQKPISASAIAPSVVFSGLITVQSNLEVSPYHSAGLSPAQHVVISVEAGAVSAVHQASTVAIEFKSSALPIQMASSSDTLTYRVGWVAGDARALRADLGRNRSIDRAGSVEVDISGVGNIDVADLYSRKVA